MNDERRPSSAAATTRTLPNRSSAGGDRLLTAAELGDLIGLSTSTVLDWWQAGKIPGFRLGGRVVRFSAHEIEAWLAECHVEARAS